MHHIISLNISRCSSCTWFYISTDAIIVGSNLLYDSFGVFSDKKFYNFKAIK
jgi:hypothetical protein